MELFYKHVPMEQINKAYLDTFMLTFHRLEIAVDMWEIYMVRLSEEEARAKLNILRWKAMRTLAQMSPAIKVF